MSLAINPGFDKSTHHGYQDCNVVTSARGCEDDTQCQSAQDRSVDHMDKNSLLCKTPKTAGAITRYTYPLVCAKHRDLRNRIFLIQQGFYLTKRIFQIICPQQGIK